MNHEKITEELVKIKEIWEESKALGNTNFGKKLQVIYNFVLSLTEPNRFTDIEKEDLRRLAKELNFTEDSNFDQWISSIRQ
ncbi:MAG: hypothetical protein AAB729_01075 [Patescibacteria group bacterium]